MGIQSGYSRGTVRVQYGYSQGTVRVQRYWLCVGGVWLWVVVVVGGGRVVCECVGDGQNSLTYMETINGMSTRSKIYNKMVQTLECKGVRDTIGCIWED